MNTRDVLEALKQYIPQNAALVASLGRTADETFRLFPHQTLFLDSMGDVSSVACGIALGLALEKRHLPVVALDTDGSHLLGLSFLPTLASIAHDLPNLLLIVLDNGIYEAANAMPSRSVELDWHTLGQAMQIDIRVIHNKGQLTEILTHAFHRFTYIVAKVENMDLPEGTEKTLDGIESKYRFIRHLEAALNVQLLKPVIKS